MKASPSIFSPELDEANLKSFVNLQTVEQESHVFNSHNSKNWVHTHWSYCSNPKNLGRDFVLGPLFFVFTVFGNFEIDDFGHLWYNIGKLLRSSFICTKGSFSALFVQVLWGLEVFQIGPYSQQQSVVYCFTESVSFPKFKNILKNNKVSH